ncbi:MAG: Maf family protein [Pseudomonadota bacterium]
MSVPDLVLASASPRRRELLSQIGVRHVVRVADIDESVRAGETPADYVRRLAEAKARAVLARLPAGEAHLPVLGADTTVVIGNELLGKPAGAADAARMLALLSGREHRVLTAVALARRDALWDERCLVKLSDTAVRFRTLDAGTIARYVATGEPLDKAGGYGIQGAGGALVQTITGSYTGVVGLPLGETVDLLDAFAVPYWRDVP